MDFYGYGLTNPYFNEDGSVFGLPQYASKLQRFASNSVNRTSSCDSGSFLCTTEASGGSDTQHGDSGGALLFDIEGDPTRPAALAVLHGSVGPSKSVGNGPAVTFPERSWSRVTDPAIHDWVVSSANIKSYPSSTILRNQSNGAAWLVESDGFRHPIPDGGTYLCEVAKGAQVQNLSQFEVDETPLSGTPANCGSGGTGIIGSGNIELGVNATGDLNVPSSYGSAQGTTTVGLRYLPTNNEFAGPGCLCEGWGVADAAAGIDGYADQASGVSGILVNSFSTTASEATSDVSVGSLRVIHRYVPSLYTADLYLDEVSITNTSGASLDDVVYRRKIDWDMEPTAFSEYSTVQGLGNSPYLRSTSNNGFGTADPLVDDTSGYTTGNFSQLGPMDQGAEFTFDFGSLSPGSSIRFYEYYGASSNRATALADLKLIKAEAYSLGEPSLGLLGQPNTAILAFSGIRGTRLRIPSALPRHPHSMQTKPQVKPRDAEGRSPLNR